MNKLDFLMKKLIAKFILKAINYYFYNGLMLHSSAFNLFFMYSFYHLSIRIKLLFGYIFLLVIDLQ